MATRRVIVKLPGWKNPPRTCSNSYFWNLAGCELWLAGP